MKTVVRKYEILWEEHRRLNWVKLYTNIEEVNNTKHYRITIKSNTDIKLNENLLCRSPQQERFNNKCAHLIAKNYPRLKSISVGGSGIDDVGLLIIGKNLFSIVLKSNYMRASLYRPFKGVTMKRNK